MDIYIYTFWWEFFFLSDFYFILSRFKRTSEFLPMDSLPDDIILDILSRLERTADRNAISVTCKRLYDLDNVQRTSIRVGCGLHPVNEALMSICCRFINLQKVEIVYSGWMFKLGKQLDDQGLRLISVNCRSLKEISLSYCTFISDDGLSCLGICSKLSSFKLKFAPRITGWGIRSFLFRCKKLVVLHLIRCHNVTSDLWLEDLGDRSSSLLRNSALKFVGTSE